MRWGRGSRARAPARPQGQQSPPRTPSCALFQLDYVVTCAVCTRADSGDIHIHKKKSQVSTRFSPEVAAPGRTPFGLGREAPPPSLLCSQGEGLTPEAQSAPRVLCPVHELRTQPPQAELLPGRLCFRMALSTATTVTRASDTSRVALGLGAGAGPHFVLKSPSSKCLRPPVSTPWTAKGKNPGSATPTSSS